jgi:hypothetical protein
MPLGIAVPDLFELAVSLVSRVALDEAFRRQQLLVPFPDSSVNVRSRPTAVGNRLDRPEVVFAGRGSQESAVSLEVRVEFIPVARVLFDLMQIVIMGSSPLFDLLIPGKLDRDRGTARRL